MKGICKKTILQNFNSLTGYVFLGMYMAMAGAIFFTNNLLSLSSDLRVLFNSLTSVIVFLLPILTMGQFAEERKQKTDELLLCSPISLTSIVLGKFFAVFIIFLMAVVITIIFPIILSFFATISILEIVGCLVGFCLLGMSLISIGLFISMLTDNPLVAAMCTYAIFALLSISGNAVHMFQSPILVTILNFVAITTHYTRFTYGVFALAPTIYYLSVTALFIFLCVYCLESRRLR